MRLPVARLALAMVAVVTLLAGCTTSHGTTYDGSCGAGHSEVSLVDAAAGTAAWSRQLAHPREEPPELRGSAVLLRGCGALVLDAGDGHRLLRQPDDSGVLGLVGGRLVSSRDGDVSAVPLTGDGGFQGSSSPPWTATAIAGDLVLTAGSGLTALDPQDGRSPWHVELPTLGRFQALAVPGHLVLRAGDGSLYGLDEATGAVSWRVVPPAGTALGYGPLLAVGATVVAVARHDGVAGLDLGTGAELWLRSDLGDDQQRSWASTGDIAAVPTRDEVVGLDLRTGHIGWRLHAASRAPVAADGTFVVDDALSYAGVEPGSGRVLWRRATEHHPLLGADPSSRSVVALDSPPVPHGMHDCC